MAEEVKNYVRINANYLKEGTILEENGEILMFVGWDSKEEVNVIQNITTGEREIRMFLISENMKFHDPNEEKEYEDRLAAARKNGSVTQGDVYENKDLQIYIANVDETEEA